MTKIALIGTGPCGLSFLRSLHQAEKNGDSIPEVVAFEKQADWCGLWNILGELVQINLVIQYLIVCIDIYGLTVQKSA